MAQPRRIHRRSFLRGLGAAALAAPFISRGLFAADSSQQVRHGSFGTSGMAATDLKMLLSHRSVKLVCVADVDLSKTADLKAEMPDLRVYQDWREMLDKEHKNLDSVNVTVPDHMHAAIGMSAMQLGLNVYGQKPLAHDVFEVRRLTEYAVKNKRVTQMGIQIHSSQEYRAAVQLVQSGAIGKIKEVHTWSSKKWGDSTPRPQKADPIPPSLNWDLWLGTAAERPYIGNEYYHPANWRKRLDFGTGTFGDMGCHIYDPVFGALALTAPISVRSQGPAPGEFNWASNAMVHYVFPGTAYTAEKTVNVTWYDGDRRPTVDPELLPMVPVRPPPKKKQSKAAAATAPATIPAVTTAPLMERMKLPDQGSLFIGTDGYMLLPHVGRPILLPEAKFKGHEIPKLENINHWHQFVEAVRGNGTTSAHFGYAGPLTEAVLLGGVATRFPQAELQWDAAGMKFPNHPDADRFLRRVYRKGWEVEGLV